MLSVGQGEKSNSVRTISFWEKSDFFLIKASKFGWGNSRGSTDTTDATLCILSTTCIILWIPKNIIIIYIILSFTIAGRRAFFRAHNVFRRHHSRRGPLRILYEVVEPSTTGCCGGDRVLECIGRWYRQVPYYRYSRALCHYVVLVLFTRVLHRCTAATILEYTAQTNLSDRKH